MNRTTTNISIRMDVELKEKAEALFSELGMNITTAINVFVRQALREGRIPFEIALQSPNEETIRAMEEAEQLVRDPNAPVYRDLDKLFADLKQ